ncbi:ABC transporter permease [Mumia sp. Pv 4-285]|uniref:ABC transporter permease n=1 Tax=Mumia qirimensis TaxID=3234852 RepID=UPI00351D23DB
MSGTGTQSAGVRTPTRAPSAWQAVARQAPYYATVLRRTWRGSAFSYSVLPALTLASLGLGLGTFVDEGGAGATGDGAAALGGLSYLAFIAPGMVAVTAVMAAAGESTFPVYAGFTWTKIYYAMRATSLRVRDLVNGAATYVAVRVLIAVVLLSVVVALFGTISTVLGGVALVGAALLVGLAHTTPIIAYAGWAKEDTALGLVFRLGIIPMTLFSGAYFPVDQLPAAVEAVAKALPVWHGVELCRMATTGEATSAAWIHVGYLLLVTAVGWVLAQRQFARRLGRI